MTQAFLDAIISTLKGTPALVTAFPGGFWPGLAPQGTDFPYITYSFVADPATQIYGSVAWDSPTVRFVGWSINLSALAASMDTFCDTLDESPLAISGGQCVDFNRDNGPTPTQEFTPGAKGNEVWRMDVVYTYAIAS